jgi:hypothetical protein
MSNCFQQQGLSTVGPDRALESAGQEHLKKCAAGMSILLKLALQSERESEACRSTVHRHGSSGSGRRDSLKAQSSLAKESPCTCSERISQLLMTPGTKELVASDRDL